MDANTTAVLFALCFLTATLHVCRSLFIEPMINDAIDAQVIVWPQTIAFIVCLAAFVFFRFLLKTYLSFICCNSELSWNKLAMNWINTRDVQLLAEKSEGEVVTIAGKRIRNLKDFLDENLESILYSPLNFLFTFCGIILIDFRTGLLIIPIIIIGVIIDLKLSNRLITSADIAYDAENNLVSWQKEAIENRESIILSQMTEYVIDQHHNKVSQFLRANNQLTKERQLSYIPSLINEYLPTIALVAIAAYKVLHGGMQYGTFLALLSLISGASLPFAHFLQSLTRIKAADPLFDDIDELIVAPDKKEPSTCDLDSQCNPLEVVCVHNLSFQYEGAEQKVLSGINLELLRGEKIAIIGQSGCGKTTLLKNILGIITDNQGYVRVFQKNVDTNKNELWDHIGYVDNNCYLFDGTVEYNITLSDRPLSSKDKEYLEEICAKLEISDLLLCPMPIYQFGNNLSGGQRLKICLARALYRRPDLFILDEPTASFDETSENALCEILSDVDATAIITTHRDDILKICNKVYKLTNGSLVQIRPIKDL